MYAMTCFEKQGDNINKEMNIMPSLNRPKGLHLTALKNGSIA